MDGHHGFLPLFREYGYFALASAHVEHGVAGVALTKNDLAGLVF